jgi:hypothetical protein
MAVGVAAGLAESDAATALADATEVPPAPFPAVAAAVPAKANADAGRPPNVSASTALSE